MKRLSDFFRSKKTPPDRRAPVSEERLAELGVEAEAARFGFKWVPLNRAGDLCERAGDLGRALEYYGRAIDVLLENGMPEPARGLATKIVRIHPGTVRTLCTLTWLDMASRHMASVMVHLTEYVERAKGSGRQDLAGEQIYMMAHVAADAELRSAAADALDALECADDAAEVRGWVAAGSAPHDENSSEDWADLCLSYALGSNARRAIESKNEEELPVVEDSKADGQDQPHGYLA